MKRRVLATFTVMLGLLPPALARADDPRAAGQPIAPREASAPLPSPRDEQPAGDSAPPAPAPRQVTPQVTTPPAASSTPTPPPGPAPSAAPLAAVPRTPVAPTPARTQQVGAAVPFTTYEAEASTSLTNGQVERLTMPITTNTTNPQIEASGRAHVRLSATGHYLQIPRVRKATGMVIRHCIPDAPAGGGATATLNVYVNGVFRQTITLSSKHNWLYGFQNNDNGQSNNPADGPAHVFWDDTRFVIQGGLNAGDTLRFQKDAANTAAYYLIDMVDLELIPPPIVPKAGTYLSVTSYGATGNDTSNDVAAFNSCISAARAQGKIAYVPPGTYYQAPTTSNASSARITVDRVHLQGAGYWHTTLWATGSQPGFQLQGSGTRVHDLSILSNRGTSRSATNQTGGDAFPSQISHNITNWSVKNVWIQHTGLGFWLRGASHGVISGCRIYLTYADAINLNRGSNNNLVVNNYIRGVGDDGLAILAQTYDNPTQAVTHNITMRYNTVIANWWGHNADLAGGYGHVMEYNYLADNSHAGAFTVNNPASYPMFPLTDSMVRGNVIVRGGSNFASQKRGAVWIYPNANDIVSLTLADNHIIDALYRGIHIVGSFNQNVLFQNNIIERPGENAIRVNTEAKGSGTFVNTVFRSLPSGFGAISNAGGSDYTLTQSGSVFE